MNKSSESSVKPVKIVTFSVLQSLFSTVKDPRDYLLLNLFLQTGLTLDEFTLLRPQDFEFTTTSLQVGQQDKKRTVKLPLDLSLQLSSYIQQNKVKTVLFKLSKQRVIQIVKARTQSLLGQSITPKEIRKIALKKTYKTTKSFSVTKQKSGLKHLRAKKVLSLQQVKSIKGHISSSKDALIFDLLFETGMTLKELISLRVSDFNNAIVTLRAETTKHNRQRSILFSEDLAKRVLEFTQFMQSSDYVFASRQGSQMSDKRVFQILKKYSKESNVEFNAQMLRNTRIALSIQNNENKEQIEQQLGVQNLRFDHYGLVS